MQHRMTSLFTRDTADCNNDSPARRDVFQQLAHVCIQVGDWMMPFAVITMRYSTSYMQSRGESTMCTTIHYVPGNNAMVT